MIPPTEATTETYSIAIALVMAVGFTIASVFGYFSQRMKCSPILGYLVAGYIIGPYSPGFVIDTKMAEQLAEIGVILMMFGVGLHLKWKELVNVKNIAVPGAIIQTLASSVAGALFIYYLGWSIEVGIVIGLAIGVASTVVMIRVLSDNHQMNTPAGHTALGWLIVEDLLTIFALLLLPELSSSLHGESISFQNILFSVGMAVLKCAVLVVVTFLFGFRIVAYIFDKVARTRSQELFTLTVLGLIFGIAVGSAAIFGTSIALGAFISGLVIGQTNVKHQASANALPFKDAFAVVFFLSVGMLFNPVTVSDNFALFLGILSIILIVKPIVAFVTVRVFKYPFEIALSVAVLLAQIGEFSFILSEEALKLDILPDEGFDIIVACALVSIGINPFLFNLSQRLKKWYQQKEFENSHPQVVPQSKKGPRAVVVGFGPIGQETARFLEETGIIPIIIDTNVDTVIKQKEMHGNVVFGDASVEHILEAANANNAELLIITTPDVTTTENIIRSARNLNPDVYIIARTLYLADKIRLDELNVTVICDEEEAKNAFHNLLMN